jgi:lipoate-protein ligase A
VNDGTLRVLRSGAEHPCFNMGLDEALLRGESSPPTLRLYRWSPRGLSLGYFQRAADFRDVPGDHVLVRRITGGGAIYHGDEITFSLTVDAAVLPAEIGASYDLVHEAVRRALADVDVATARRGGSTGSARPAQRWCFADPVCEDLLTPTGHKILGSAQRRLRRPVERVLHHGSLVLHAPVATPFCGSVAEETDPRDVESALEEAMVEHLAAALRLTATEGRPTDQELARAEELAKTQYATEAFTLRR